jgi:hypothetical protein
MEDRCPSCGTPAGRLHEPFCARELCPFCGDFVTTCECIFEVLGLSDAELALVEEYEDDSVEPLRGIAERWAAAVAAKGRVPFDPTPTL